MHLAAFSNEELTQTRAHVYSFKRCRQEVELWNIDSLSTIIECALPWKCTLPIFIDTLFVSMCGLKMLLDSCTQITPVPLSLWSLHTQNNEQIHRSTSAVLIYIDHSLRDCLVPTQFKCIWKYIKSVKFSPIPSTDGFSSCQLFDKIFAHYSEQMRWNS